MNIKTLKSIIYLNITCYMLFVIYYIKCLTYIIILVLDNYIIKHI